MTSLSAPPTEDLLSVLTSQQQPQLWGTSPLTDKISRQPILVWRARLSQKALRLPTSCNVKALPSGQQSKFILRLASHVNLSPN